MKSFVLPLGLLACSSLLLVLWAAPVAEAAGGRAVDVLLSVGKPGTDATCQPDSEGACDLAKVRVDLATRAATKVSTVVAHGAMGASGSGIAEPAVSPNGTRVAWLERGGTGVQLWAKAFTESEGHLILKSSKGKGGDAGMRPEWPEWLDDDTLLFSSKTGTEDGKEQKTIFAVEVADLARPGAPVARAGAGVSGWTGVQDSAVFRGRRARNWWPSAPFPAGAARRTSSSWRRWMARGSPSRRPS